MPRPIRAFLFTLTALTALCLLCEGICRWVLHRGYPYDWPLLFPAISFMDFWFYIDHVRNTFHTAAFFDGPAIIMYPSPVVILYKVFYLFQPIATPVFLAFIVGSLVAAAGLAGRALVRRGLSAASAMLLIAATCAMAYPFWFEFKQANMEIVVWVVLSLGLFSFFKERTWTAALLFGLAGAFKFYPIIFLGLLLSRKRYKECAVGCVFAGVVLLASLWYVGPTIPVAWHGMQKGLGIFQTYFMFAVRPHEIGFDHSLFGLMKKFMRLADHTSLAPRVERVNMAHLLTAYLATAACVGTLLYFRRIRHLPLPNQVLCLTIASILLPPVSFDYTLIHLYAPWLLVCFFAIRSGQRNVPMPGATALLLGLALAVAPLSELIFHTERVGGQIRAVVLLTLFGMSLYVPIPYTARERDEGPAAPTRNLEAAV